MKQHITKEQWDCLSIADKMKVFSNPRDGLAVFTDSDENKRWEKVTIGQMIWFLGDDVEYINHHHGKWYVGKNPTMTETTAIGGWSCEARELRDALWMSVKFKLKV